APVRLRHRAPTVDLVAEVVEAGARLPLGLEALVGVDLGAGGRDEYGGQRSEDDQENRHRHEELGERETALLGQAHARAARKARSRDRSHATPIGGAAGVLEYRTSY